ncbi:hypothetical protein OG233_14175 [Streptomyces sp. NBC_01218]|uniref:hypothetical protein n=1 Tax=Streptomyces sp. NBC_01218 TaxID=2903780 RepID=UPI002E13973D|nr:hypothetical protein OG233_14175 [Streptomyces sp. NBC_01218]
MPITPPEYPSTNDALRIRVSSLDADIQVNYTVRPDQIEAWTSEQLLAKVATLKDAVRGLLPAGVDLQTNILWGRDAQTSVLHEVETVKAVGA